MGVPAVTALAALIGLQIARHSLRPIHRVIACADVIAGGELSRRVPEEPAADELGALTRTLNRMLASLEDSFRRERRFTVLLNLTENAVKYGKDGGDVWVSAIRQGKQAELTVADNGVGVSPENLPHLFERFFRADTARDRTGTGLGLAIAQWIVTLHGGSIRAESELGTGTRFIVALPLRPQ